MYKHKGILCVRVVKPHHGNVSYSWRPRESELSLEVLEILNYNSVPLDPKRDLKLDIDPLKKKKKKKIYSVKWVNSVHTSVHSVDSECR